MAAERVIPARELTCFSSRDVTAMTNSRGHASAGKSGSAKLSVPFGRLPACISTKPPKIDLAADPDPWRATMLNSLLDSVRFSARAAAAVKAAYPDAEDASPAPVGEIIATGHAGCVGHTRPRAKQIQAPAHPVELLRTAATIQCQLVGRQGPIKMNFRIGPECVQRDGDGADGRNVQWSAVRLAPILDQRDIGARSRCRLHVLQSPGRIPASRAGARMKS